MLKNYEDKMMRPETADFPACPFAKRSKRKKYRAKDKEADDIERQGGEKGKGKGHD